MPPENIEINTVFIFVVKCFRPLGLCPVKISHIKGKPKIEQSRTLTIAVILILLSIWAALIGSFFVNFRSPLITGVANHVQFITSVLALTVAIGVPISRCKELYEIMQDFTVIDDELKFFDLHSDQKSQDNF